MKEKCSLMLKKKFALKIVKSYKYANGNSKWFTEDSCIWMMCALWTCMKHYFMASADLHASNCSKLKTCFLCCNSTFLPAWLDFFSDYILWQGFSLFLIWRAFYLWCCLLWLWFLDMRLSIACTFCMGKVTCLTITFTSATFVNWTCASMKQRVTTQRMLV